MRRRISPNNYPRESQHNMVTAADLERLEKFRPQLNQTIEYTIGGEVEGTVHTSVEADRHGTLTRGYRRLEQASQSVENGFEIARGDVVKPFQKEINSNFSMAADVKLDIETAKKKVLAREQDNQPKTQQQLTNTEQFNKNSM